ncbi:MAG: O-antigen ligase family protein [Pirellulaceae bacterium]
MVSAITAQRTSTATGRSESRAPIVLGCALMAAVVLVNQSSFRVRAPDDLSADWQVLLRVAVCGLCGLFGLMHLSRTIELFFRPPGVLVLAFAGWAALSVFFARDLRYSAVAAVSLFCMVLFAPAVVQRLGARRIAATIVASTTLLLIGCWAAYYLTPDLGREPYALADPEDAGRLAGLMHPNGTGSMASLLIAILLVAWVSGWLRWWMVLPLLVFAAATLWASGSKTALGSAMFAALLVVTHRLPRPVTVLAGGFGAALALIMLAALSADADSVLRSISRTNDAEEILSFTGRVELWKFTLHEIGTSPLFGHGFACSRFVNEGGPDWAAGSHAHNLLLNVMVETGVVGGMLLIAMLLAQFFRAYHGLHLLPIVMTGLVLVEGVTGSVVFTTVPNAHTLLWLAALFPGWAAGGVGALSDPARGANVRAIDSGNAPLQPSWGG